MERSEIQVYTVSFVTPRWMAIASADSHGSLTGALLWVDGNLVDTAQVDIIVSDSMCRFLEQTRLVYTRMDDLQPQNIRHSTRKIVLRLDLTAPLVAAGLVLQSESQ